MTIKEQHELGKTLWRIADDLRGSMMADDFRDYMLSFLFLRYISDNYIEAARKELGGDYPDKAPEELKEHGVSTPLQLWYGENPADVLDFEKQMRRKVHYVIEPDYLWTNIYELARTQNDDLLKTLEKGFKYIENESFDRAFQGLFSEINLNSDKLGKNYDGHFGFTGPVSTLNFLQDFGLILFVYCIGLQVGPGFFESFKKGGVTLNLLACGIVALNILVMLVLYYCVFDTNDPRNLPMMVGVLCGAVTNTPGLGAATEALTQVFANAQAVPQIASGYACAYPLGVVGIIAATISIRYICGIVLKDEEDRILAQQAENPHAKPHKMTLKVTNTALHEKTLLQVRDFLGRNYVCSRALHEGHVSIPTKDTKFYLGDHLFITCAEDDAEAVRAFIGPEEYIDWDMQDMPMVSKSIVVTQPKMNGKTFGQLHFSSVYGVNVTRISRSGMNLFADRNLRMQVGDKIVVVGPEDAVDRVASLLGNSVKRLDHPNLVTIFVGILVGTG